MKTFQGLMINKGYAIGKIVTKMRDFKIEKKDVLDLALEKQKLDNALFLAESKLLTTDHIDFYPFLEAHLLILKDEFVKKEIFTLLEIEKCNIEYAYKTIMDKYINRLKSSTDEYLRERYLDLCDIENQVLEYLIPHDKGIKIIDDSILIVKELFPSDIINLDKKIKGIISFKGGITSHSAILCRAYNIPYIQIEEHDLTQYSRVMINNSKVIFDYENELKIEKVIEEYMIDTNKYNVWANVNFNHEIDEVLKLNFFGIGLYRSEYLMLEKNRFLSLDEQYLVYYEVLKRLYPKPVIIRTFDLGKDKTISGYGFKIGFENYKMYPELINNQIEGLIRANLGNLRIMFPNIKANVEFMELRDLVLRTCLKLKKNEPIMIGMMIETKEAIENIKDYIFSDFFSIGTNDLMLNLYDIKREEKSKITDEILNDLKRRVKKVVEFCTENKKEISACGEFATTKKGLDLFTSVGINDYSVGIHNTNYIIKRKKIE